MDDKKQGSVLAAALASGWRAMSADAWGGQGGGHGGDYGCDAVCMQRLLHHLQELDRWRSRLNLTTIRTPDEMVSKHTLDSLVLLPWLHGERVLDIGTGAGFPGLSLASARPDWAFTLLDSRGKRIEFLRYVLAGLHDDLSLPRVELVHSRVEQFHSGQFNGAAKFDTLVARAVSSLVNLFAMTKHLQAPGVRLLAMKGQYPEDEIKALEQAASKHAFELEVVSLQVPGVTAERHVVVVDFQ